MSTKFKKLIPFLLILVVLAGAFAFTNKASASEEDPSEDCTYNVGGKIGGTVKNAPCINTAGEQIGDNSGKRVEKIEPKSPLEDELAPCGVFGDSKLIGCVQWLVYFVFVAAPSFIMVVTANLFNLVAAMTLSSGMYQSTFIQTIWVVVRDLANIFFILILLYAAMQIILDIGNGSSKKIVASVILIALLVNFSLFFTKVVIDSSNIAALIFYNRIDTTNTNYNPIRSDTGEKDMAGALVSKFKINNFFSGDLIKDLKKDPLVKIADEDKLSPYMTMGMMMVYGLVAYALCYSFFMVAMALFGRMLNLMMLMIISPVAFVTKSIPSLSKKENMGFDSWLANLLQTAFMATIFMFILYMVATILKAEIFNVGINPNNQGAAATLVKLFMPAILIVALLLKGVKYSMSASGQFTGMVMTAAKMAGVVGVGLATGGTAMLGRNVVGRSLKAASGSESAARFRAGTPSGVVDHTFGRLGNYINKQKESSETGVHARRDLDKVAQEKFHDKFENLTAPERSKVAERVVKDKKAEEKYGKNYNKLDEAEKTVIDGLLAASLPTDTANLLKESKQKQTLRNTVLQSARTGTYDIRNLADVVAQEQGTLFSKLATGVAVTMGSTMRSGFKQMSIGNRKGEETFFKSLGVTITDALKNVNVNVDLSHLGEEKKESHSGGGH